MAKNGIMLDCDTVGYCYTPSKEGVAVGRNTSLISYIHAGVSFRPALHQGYNILPTKCMDTFKPIIVVTYRDLSFFQQEHDRSIVCKGQ